MTSTVTRNRAVRWAAVVLFAAWLLWMTLRPNETVAADLSPLTSVTAAGMIPTGVLINLIGNIIVFVPLGVGLVLAIPAHRTGKRWLVSTLAGTGFSVVIELLQSAVPGRVSAGTDCLLNTAGTGLGAWLGCLLCRCGDVTPAELSQYN